MFDFQLERYVSSDWHWDYIIQVQNGDFHVYFKEYLLFTRLFLLPFLLLFLELMRRTCSQSFPHCIMGAVSCQPVQPVNQQLRHDLMWRSPLLYITVQLSVCELHMGLCDVHLGSSPLRFAPTTSVGPLCWCVCVSMALLPGLPLVPVAGVSLL